MSAASTQRTCGRKVRNPLTMTTAERRDPDIINGSRKRRIARGSGTTVAELNDLLSQFRQMQRLMKQMSNQRRGRGGLQGLLGMLR